METVTSINIEQTHQELFFTKSKHELQHLHARLDWKVSIIKSTERFTDLANTNTQINL